MQRWLAYCRERFPLLQHGVVIAAFAFASLAVADAATGARGGPSARTLPIAFAFAFPIAFLAFLELRILDEFKDADDDTRYRPYRPVPRGLVSLRELRRVGVAGAIAQVALAAAAGHAALAFLLAAFAWMGLMAREFFVRAWLRARPLAYLATHTVIVPLIALVVAACRGAPPDVAALAPFLALTCATSVVFEIGRKIRAPADERTGVETYSALWGPRTATVAWWSTLAASSGLAVLSATLAGGAAPVALLACATLVASVIVAARFLARPTTGTSKALQTLSGAWLVAAYVALGVVAAAASP